MLILMVKSKNLNKFQIQSTTKILNLIAMLIKLNIFIITQACLLVEHSAPKMRPNLGD
jgi:hypothetical protein